MIAGNEQAVRSAWQVLTFRGTALKDFDISVEGFRQSWWALALSLPLGLFGVAVLNLGTKNPIGLPALTVFMCLNWLIGVGGVVFFAFLLKQSQKLSATIIVLNWVSLWANLVFVLPNLLVFVGLPLAILQLMQIGMIAYFSLVQGFVLWRLWGISINLVIGIVMCLVLIDRLSNELFFAVTRPVPAEAISLPAESEAKA
jgi:hypothetical protein